MRRTRFGLAAAVVVCVSTLLGRPPAVRADIASDHPAAILVFPKLLVDTANGLDTLVRITNISAAPINVKCFYVNVTPKCSLEQATSCFPNRSACFRAIGDSIIPGKCLPQWQETDFYIRLTREQPTGWLVSGGESVNCRFLNGVCSSDKTTICNDDGDCGIGRRCIKPPCLPLDGGFSGRTGPGGQTNQNSAVPLAPQDPFIGELKCIALDEADRPVARNDLIGTVLLGRYPSGPDAGVEVGGYNAIGIPALLNVCQSNGRCSATDTTCQSNLQCQSLNNRDGKLVLGGPNAEYDGCPNVLILDHYFDGAADPLITNICTPGGTCSVSGTECISDVDCVENVCLGSGTCSVTGTPCAIEDDCRNTCITGNVCVGNQCSITGETCLSNAGCANSVCSLSGQRCTADRECADPGFRARVATSLTLIPCTQDFESQQTEFARTTVQFLVYNEFEQRYSTSTPVECFKEILLSNIDTPQNTNSIFSAGVMGTLTGQTRIRGVDNADPRSGNALLAVAEEYRCTGPTYQFPFCNLVDETQRLVGTTAKNVHFQGRRPQSDFLYLPFE